MKAQEMFEELGYKKITDDNEEIIYKFEQILMGELIIQYIKFCKASKTIFSYNDNHYMGFGLKELQAINQQCKELGWINENQ